MASDLTELPVVDAANDVWGAKLNAALQALDAAKASTAEVIPVSEKGAPSGVATLGSDGKVPTAQLPAAGASGVTSVNGDAGPDVVLSAADVGAASTAQGALADSAVQPDDLATVATTGAYGDLSGRPAVVDSPDDIGAVPASRTVTAGAGLSGGGDLTADRTLSVQYGAASGTSAQGNDARLVDNAKAVKGGAEKVAAGSATTGTVTLDCSAASVFTITPTGNFTLAPSNVPTSGTACTITVIISQTGTVRTLTMPSGTVWLGPSPSQVASKKCAVTMLTTDGGASWIASGAVQA